MQQIKTEVRAKTAGYITAALGLVAGLAWNDAISAFIEHVFPVGTNTLILKFAYAIAMTVAAVIVGNYLIKLFVVTQKESEASKGQS